MPVSYCYVRKDDNSRVNLGVIDAEMGEYDLSIGGKGGEGLEEIVSTFGVMFLQFTGGFAIDRKQLEEWLDGHKVSEIAKRMYVEFLVNRYTFSAWR